MTLEVKKGVVRLEAGVTSPEQLDFRPRALVLWWCQERSAGCAGGIGFATDGGGDASAAWVADDSLAPGVLSRCGAEAPLLFHAYPRTPAASFLGHVHFADWGFSVECGRDPEQPWLVHYLALGGPEVRGAAVRSFVLGAAGARRITGLGFTPGVVLAALGAGSTAGEPRSGLAVGFGAAARQSGQVAGGFVSQVEAGGTIARGAQCTDAIAVLPAAVASGEVAALSRIASFDADGFTLETTRLTAELPLAVLALEGGNFGVGLGSASSRATAVGFELAGALLFGTGLDAMSQARDIGRLCMGGFSRDRRAGCVSWSTRRRGAWPPAPRSRSTTEAVFEVVDTTPGGLHARATLSALRGRRFLLSWVRDRPHRDFGYVAFGTELGRPTLRERLRLVDRGGSLRE
jgi:hypothetical protein